MEEELEGDLSASPRHRRRSAAERRLIVEETLEAGTSVARVAQKHGINANQLFQWRRLYRNGHLGPLPQSGMNLLPVSEVEATESTLVTDDASSAGAIHVELPGEVRISFDGRVDPSTVRAVLESLRAFTAAMQAVFARIADLLNIFCLVSNPTAACPAGEGLQVSSLSDLCELTLHRFAILSAPGPQHNQFSVNGSDRSEAPRLPAFKNSSKLART